MDNMNITDLTEFVMVDGTSLETEEQLYACLVAALRLLRKRARTCELYVTFNICMDNPPWDTIIDPKDGYSVEVSATVEPDFIVMIASHWLEEHERLALVPDGLWCFFQNVNLGVKDA